MGDDQRKKIGDKSKGIVDSLNEEENDLEEKKEKEIQEKKEDPNTLRRTYIIHEKHMKKLYEMKMENPGVSMSEIVRKAIDEYYKKHG